MVKDLLQDYEISNYEDFWNSLTDKVRGELEAELAVFKGQPRSVDTVRSMYKVVFDVLKKHT